MKQNSNRTGERVFSFSDGGSRYAYLVGCDSKSKLMEFVISNGGKTKEQKIAAKALPYARWTHLAVTLENGKGVLYVDGKPVGMNPRMNLKWDTVVAPNLLESAPRLDVGKGFTGLIDDFRVYVRPQPASTIAQLAGKFADRSAGTAASSPVLTLPTPEFLQRPALVGNAVVMSMKRVAGDGKWIEFRFQRQDGFNSGWISANRWTDAQAEPGRQYTYSVQRRDSHGNVSKPARASISVPALNVSVPEGTFDEKPVGVSDNAIRMKAKPCNGMEYRFIRGDGKASEWQSSPMYVDQGLTPGSEHAYRVQMRFGEEVGKPSDPLRAIARDDLPPARYPQGEWQTRPLATVENELLMRAMSVTGGAGLPKIEDGEVEYYFECVKGGGPDSGWIKSPFFKTPSLPIGDYAYRFKIRDLSKQKNETGWSATEEGSVTPFSGYHPYNLAGLSTLEEGTLVSFMGKVDKVEPEHYTVASGTHSIKVVPQTRGFKTDASLLGKAVAVRGGVWIVSGEKRITWAEVKEQ